MVTHGITSRTSKPEVAPTAGMKTDLQASAIVTNTCVSALRYGMARTRYSRNDLFGLSGPEGNHGEDVKELYWYEESTPTHSYASMRYYYPQQAFPYENLRAENAKRGYADREYEISDTGVFDDNRFFDIRVSFAKASAEDILISITVTNKASVIAPLYLIPQLWVSQHVELGLRKRAAT